MNSVFKALSDAGVRYLLIGGQAMRLNGMPRFSMDWDVFISPKDEVNFDRINQTLGDKLDLPVLPLGDQGENFLQTYQLDEGILQFHLAIPGVGKFDEAYERKEMLKDSDGSPIPCLSAKDLLAAKQAANRPEDQLDIEFLKRKIEATH